MWRYLVIATLGVGLLHAQEAARSNVKPSLPATNSAGQAEQDGHRRMLLLLDEIRRQSERDNDYFGARQLENLREELAALPADAARDRRYLLYSAIGKHELRLGNNQQAVDTFLKALEFARPGLEEPLLDLAVAYLRVGETENCIHRHNPDRCLFPIRGGGVHENKDGAEAAARYLGKLLERNPKHATARWLLSIAGMSLGEYPEAASEHRMIPPEAFASEQEFPRFIDVAPSAGLSTVSLSGGAVADDFDNDGYLDVMVSDWHPGAQLRYFRNNGDGTFTDQTEEAGLQGLLGGLNLVQADYDNDGSVDVLVLRGAWFGAEGRHPNSLLKNLGGGRFRDVTFEAGLGETHYPTQTAAWADYNNDGRLDLFVGNEGYPSQLFRNDGNGKFTDIAKQAGIKNDEIAKAVIWGDVDGDGFPDLYVSNFGGLNRLYRNNGGGAFTDIAFEAGVATPLNSFPAWFWDFNNDGALDLYVSSYERRVDTVALDYLSGGDVESEPDSLYRGDGRGSFVDAAAEMNLHRVTQPMGSNFGDLDSDGFPDFYLGTGYPGYEGLMPNLLFRNQEGKRFADVTTAAGVGHLQKGHGVAFADLDNDGDLDLFVRIGGAYPGDVFADALYENPGFGNHWISIKLVGTQSNRSAIGARIRAEIEEQGKRRSIYTWVNSGGSFGANPLQQYLGLGKASRVETLEVFWPTSKTSQRFENVAADQFIEVVEGEEPYRRLPRKAFVFKKRR